MRAVPFHEGATRLACIVVSAAAALLALRLIAFPPTYRIVLHTTTAGAKP